MFTGIVQSMGEVREVEPRGGDRRLHLHAAELEPERIAPGASIAVNGVCLTVVAATDRGFAADVSRATLDCTTLGRLTSGDPVNLEPALQIGAALDGHWVSGHVDGVGRVVAILREARSRRVEFESPPQLLRYIARKGSICVDGVSLTVNELDGRRFEVNAVPHTWQATIMQHYVPGRRVNLEVDLLARYLERLLASEAPADAATRSGADGNERP